MIVSVEFPTDQGFWGRECKRCKKYFKIHVEDLQEKSYCAYCGEEFDNLDLNTPEQQDALDKVKRQLGLSVAEKLFGDMMQDVFKNSKIWEYKPGKKTQITPPKEHLEKKVDSALKCSCGTRFHVFGIFGFCPGCRDENIMIYEENLKIILKEIEESDNMIRQLRHAYNDLVSTFERFGKQYGDKLGIAKGTNYQDLKNVVRAFKKFDIDIYEGISLEEKLIIKKIFQKRHVLQHNAGRINEKFQKQFPEEEFQLGEQVPLDKNEFICGAEVLKKVINNILKSNE
ncbi:MAG: hypothetical protein RIM99_06410 [Cyclobacteriaceae bacterium]